MAQKQLVLVNTHNQCGEQLTNCCMKVSASDIYPADLLQAKESQVLLDDVPYGSNGSFAINVWVQPVDLTGNNHQYIFSHGLVDTAYDDHWQANQVSLLGPGSLPLKPAGFQTCIICSKMSDHKRVRVGFHERICV